MNTLHKRGVPPLDIIAFLAEEKRLLCARIAELESIAPRKMRAKDGKVYVWNCPPELLPFTDVGL